MRRYRDAAVKQVAKGDSRTSLFLGLGKPQQGGGSGLIRYPEDLNLCRRGRHKQRPINVVVRAGLIEVIGTSSQQMNSVEVDNWFSLPMLLGLPPKKSRSTKTGLFGRFDLTSKVSKVKTPRVKVGPVVRLVY